MSISPLSASPLSSESSKQADRPIDLQNLADHIQEKLDFPFSGVVAFQEGDKPPRLAAHCPEQASFTPNQPFNVLSVGKLFTSTAVMQIIEKEKAQKEPWITLKTPLSQLLSESEMDLPLRPPYEGEKPDPEALRLLRKNASKLTVEQLLTHRGGLGNFRKEDPREGFQPEMMDTYNYSNYGYQLLARIIGKWPQNNSPNDHEAGFLYHIENRIFNPAGMMTAIRELHKPTKSLDHFEISPDQKREKVEGPEPYPHGNGCFRMNAADLLAFHQALLQHNVLLSNTVLHDMLEHSPRPLGFMRDGAATPNDPITGYGHPGKGKGMSSFIWTWLRKSGQPVTGVALSNYSTPPNRDVKCLVEPIILSSK